MLNNLLNLNTPPFVKTFIFNFSRSFRKYTTQLNDRRKFFFKKYAYTINHKRIALNYLYFVFVTALSGTALATMVRLELAHPGSPFFKGDSLRYLQIITAHGLIMVFFVVVPLIFGVFANYVIPYHVGAKDVAYPRLNSIGFWIQPVGYLLVAKVAFLRSQYWKYYEKTSLVFPILDKLKKANNFEFTTNSILSKSFFTKNTDNSLNTLSWDPRRKLDVLNEDKSSFIPSRVVNWRSLIQYPESFWFVALNQVKSRRKKYYFTKCSNRALTAAGWTFITPFSSSTKYTGIGTQDLLIVSVIAAGVSTTISFTNLLVTRRTLAMPGMRNRRVLMPFLTITTLMVLRLLCLITPVLGAAMIMMMLDRHWRTTFFEYSYGGDPILSQHIFWFFGHPEVYVLIIPTFGIVNQAIPYANTRRVASKHHMIWAVYVMAYMGFLVWGHHMYLVGLDHRSRTMYSTITIMISLPATIKMVNWTLSLVNGALKVDVPLLYTISYLFFFTVAGFTGMWLSHVGLNVTMHDTFYVIAHFHLMLSGTAIMGLFIGFYYYFTSIFGIKYSRFFAILQLIYYTAGNWLAFLPQFFLGFSGMPRRIHDYPIAFTGWHSMSTTGHMITLVGITFFYITMIDAHIERKMAIPTTLGIPRWHKRVQYYLFKIRYLQLHNKKFSNLPNSAIQLRLQNRYFNEYEVYTSK